MTPTLGSAAIRPIAFQGVITANPGFQLCSYFIPRCSHPSETGLQELACGMRSGCHLGPVRSFFYLAQRPLELRGPLRQRLGVRIPAWVGQPSFHLLDGRANPVITHPIWSPNWNVETRVAPTFCT
jgi:hypothetical protein